MPGKLVVHLNNQGFVWGYFVEIQKDRQLDGRRGVVPIFFAIVVSTKW